MSKPSQPSPRTQPPQPRALQTIDPAALAQVSGGVTAAATTDDQVLTALTGILSSIQQLGQQKNGFGMNPTEMMMFMMVMQQRNQQGFAAAAAGYPWAQPIVYY